MKLLLVNYLGQDVMAAIIQVQRELERPMLQIGALRRFNDECSKVAKSADARCV